MTGQIDTAAFGRTGHASTRVIFGAAALGSMSQDAADRVLATLLEFGVNHIDTAASYRDSELRVGPWMDRHRDRFFLATKTGERSGEGARASLERSVERLRTDHVDLIQLHNLVEEDEWAAAHAPGGAVEALAAARDEGLVRFIGVTGHGLRIADMHRRSLERFDFDSVLLPYNFTLLQHPGYRDAVEALLAMCSQRGVAVQTIKSMARRRWADDDAPHYSWYEPIAGDGPVGRAARWVLGRPGLFLNTSSDARLLRLTLEAVTAGGPVPTETDMAADVDALGVQPIFDGGALERI
ncbi:aldo/keto reductase [Acidiferrimicrobium sp. IK]|uniref:aldo/keto reductase n=1 Tax=Acidiferrimicrobium sp. IK TaxID=2871700 RepID=UPI0021CB45B8|nr:aldo/keto reductase [Acidiferrimicrobium sp. IK]MCU4186263.1 aldo/keto reductase [Acidiferrimicrobium sp. IK]